MNSRIRTPFYTFFLNPVYVAARSLRSNKIIQLFQKTLSKEKQTSHKLRPQGSMGNFTPHRSSPGLFFWMCMRWCCDTWKLRLKQSLKYCFNDECECFLRVFNHEKTDDLKHEITGRLAFTVFECLETLMKHAVRVFEIGFQQTDSELTLTQWYTQLKSFGVKVLWVFHLHDNVAPTLKWNGNTWNKTFYSQRIWIGCNINFAESIYRA